MDQKHIRSITQIIGKDINLTTYFVNLRTEHDEYRSQQCYKHQHHVVYKGHITYNNHTKMREK